MGFGERLRELRRQAGLSQTKLANRVGVSNGYICDLERGRRGVPTGPILQRIAQALGVSVDTLLGGKEPPPKTHLTPERRGTLAKLMRDAHFSEKDISLILDVIERISN